MCGHIQFTPLFLKKIIGFSSEKKHDINVWKWNVAFEFFDPLKLFLFHFQDILIISSKKSMGTNCAKVDTK